ncbi:MAG: histidine phosphatase family protein [Proteobacteria bacterium]|nr:histidine phosphatase family protein [Pseudomonadota bacterium]
MSKLLLVRHGNTTLNSAERFWGQTDVELSAAGIRQAEQLRDRLATQKLDAIYTSNLSRAIVTAEIIASRHQLDVITCAELREINFGYVEGLTFDEISRLYPELAKLLVNWSIRPRFPGGESIDDLNNRVRKFLARLEKHTAEETVLIVTEKLHVYHLLMTMVGLVWSMVVKIVQV